MKKSEFASIGYIKKELEWMLANINHMTSFNQTTTINPSENPEHVFTIKFIATEPKDLPGLLPEDVNKQ